MVARVALLVLAVVVVGWLGVSISSSGAQDELIRLGFRIGPAPDRARIQELADRGRVLSPDRRVDLAEGVALQRANDTAGAIAAFERAARAEPESIEAWALLARVADPQRAAEARRRVRELAPPVR
jgi:hypothetical protein